MAHLFRLIAIALAFVLLSIALLFPLRALAQACFEYKATTNATGWNTWSTTPEAALSAYVAWRTSQVQACGPGVYTTQQRFRVGTVNPTGTEGTFEISTAGGQVGCPGEEFYGPYTLATTTIASRSATCPPPDVCGALAALNTPVYVSVPGAALPGGTTCNGSGCAMSFSGTVIRVKNSSGVSVTEGDATFTGAGCTPDPNATATPDSCPGGTSGEINGISTCVPFDPNLNVIESDKATDTSKTDSTGTTTTGKTTSTVCTGAGSCTTTTTTTTSVNGGAPTTTTETKEENRNDFCKENPTSPQCTNSAFSGSCTGGFTCTGDAVQCAAAKQLHQLNCSLDKTSSQKDLFNAERTNDSNPLTVNPSQKSISPGDFDSSNSLGMSQGVSDVSITVMDQSIVLPFSNLNQYLAQLRLVLLACAWFIAYRIVSGSVRS